MILLLYWFTTYLLLYFIITCTIFIIYIHVNINRGYQLQKTIKSETPSNCTVIYVIDFDNDTTTIFNIFYKSLIFIIKKIFNYCNNINEDNKILFDMDDSEGITEVIRKSSNDNLHLMIFINSFGGNVSDSDTICTALQTYQTNSQKKKTGLKITCIIDKTAKSAGSMLALSGDYVYMNDFAVLGPTDPQIVTMCGDMPCVLSSQIFDEIDKNNNGTLTLNCGEYLMMKNQTSYYQDNINIFKRLKQYIILPKCNKQKMIHMFCENSGPHHKDFNVFDLEELGIKIRPLKIIHKKMLELFKQYEKLKNYI